MSVVMKYKAKPPSFKAAAYDEMSDALQTIAEMIGAKTTKVDSVTYKAEFTLPPLPGEEPFMLEVEIGSMVIQGEGRPYTMSKLSFYELYEIY